MLCRLGSREEPGQCWSVEPSAPRLAVLATWGSILKRSNRPLLVAFAVLGVAVAIAFLALGPTANLIDRQDSQSSSQSPELPGQPEAEGSGRSDSPAANAPREGDAPASLSEEVSLTQLSHEWQVWYRYDCVQNADGVDVIGENCPAAFSVARSVEEARWLYQNNAPTEADLKRAPSELEHNCSRRGSARSCMALASAAFRAGQLQAAERWAQIAVDLAPQTAMPHRLLAEVLTILSDIEVGQAIGADGLVSADDLQLLPGSVRTRYQRAATHLAAASLLGDRSASHQLSVLSRGALTMIGADIAVTLAAAYESAVQLTMDPNSYFAIVVSPANRRPGW